MIGAAHQVNLPVFAGLVGPLAAGVGIVAWKTRELGGGDRGGWATGADLRPLTVRGPKPGRVVLGTVGRRLLATEERASLLVLGPSQSGKTTRLAGPALREWDGPVVATSVKRDLVDLTVAARKTRGPVWIFDPTRLDTARWDPLDGCSDWQGAVRTAAALVEAGRPASGHAGVEDPSYWQQSAEKLLAPILFAGAREGQTMTDVVSIIDIRAWDAVSKVIAVAGSKPAANAWHASTHRDAKQLSSIVGTCETLVSVFADPMVGHATSRSDFTPAEVLDGTGTLYIVGPLHEQQRLRPLFVALVKSLLAYAYEHGPLDPSCLLVLDELANVAPIPDLDQVASTGAGLGVQLVSVVQDLAQLSARYGEDRTRTLVSNHRCLLALPGLKDLNSLRTLSELIGDHDTPRRSHTRGSDGRSSLATAPERRRLAPVEQLRRMKRGEGLLLYGAAKPARLKLLKEGPQRR